ncbi:MAG TPA: cytochrome c [Caulobacteraceae bacterium]|nr:cytochrome c [Caulobacteraceae bacterium]
MKTPLILAAALALAGCDLSMTSQPRASTEGSADLWPGGPRVHGPPAGAVPVNGPALLAAQTRPPMSLALVERGRNRFDIYCLPCHGERGRGDGPVVERGFPAPPSYDEARLLAAPASHFYDVETNGYGVMFSYADRLSAPDRWAVAAYVRALQLADLESGAASPAAASPAAGPRP